MIIRMWQYVDISYTAFCRRSQGGRYLAEEEKESTDSPRICDFSD